MRSGALFRFAFFGRRGVAEEVVFRGHFGPVSRIVGPVSSTGARAVAALFTVREVAEFGQALSSIGLGLRFWGGSYALRDWAESARTRSLETFISV